MKKLMACVLTLCLMASALIGCAAFSSPSAGAEATTSAETETVVNVTPVPTASESEQKSAETDTSKGASATDTPTENEDGQSDETVGGKEPDEQSKTESDEEADGQDDAEGGATDAPSESDAPVQTSAPVAAEALPTSDYGSGPAYVLDHGYKHYGDPTELVALGQTIYLYQSLVLEINGYTIDELAEIAFALDPDVFDGDDNVVYLSVRDPNGQTKSGTVYVWPGKKADAVPTSERLAEVIDADDEDIMEYEIQVTPTDFSATEPCAPTFTLVAFPAIAQGMSFAVSIDEGEPVAFAGDSYTPDVSGEYRFCLLDASGARLALSAKFDVTLVQADESGEAVDETKTEETELTEPDGIAPTMLGAPLTGASEIELIVTTIGYQSGVSSATSPIFQLSGLPAEGNYSYAFKLDDGDWTQLLDPCYTATQQGSYTLSLAIVDESDAPVSSVKRYAISLEPTLAGSSSAGQAWTLVEGARVDGTLSDLLETSGSPIYIFTSATIVLESGYGALSGKTLLPDPSAYSSGKVVCVSEHKDGVESDSGIFVWVDDIGAAGTEAVTLSVTPTALTENAWTNVMPSFALSSAPDLPVGYSYAVALSGGSPILLSEATYDATDEGEYTLQFLIVDATGATMAQSAEYSLKLDFTAPLLNVSTADKYIMKVIAGDAVSGGYQVSINGGKQWSSLTASSTAGVSYRQYSGTKATTFAAGQIVVKDHAGNQTASTSAVTLFSTAAAGTGANNNNNGADTTAKTTRTISHAKSTATDIVAYNGVELVLDDGSMSQLIVGDEPLDLELYRDSFLVSDDDEAAEPVKPTFTAAFTSFSGDESDGVDTLTLTATDPTLTLADTYSYTWEFSGVVYKKLAASGIDYLVLRIGDNVTVLSTAGFSAGIRYNMYRADGMTSKEFRYTIRMGMPGPTFEMDVTVGGETYAMTADSSSEFYYYDVYTGTTNQLGEIQLDSLEG